MKSTIINNFVDRKIYTSFSEKRGIDEVMLFLVKNIKDKEQSDMKEPFKSYMINFMNKRLDDLIFITSKNEFEHIDGLKILKLIQLKDKLNSLPEIELRLGDMFLHTT
jgi:hypothetical protein